MFHIKLQAGSHRFGPMIIFTDQVLSDISTEIARKEPELGGALLGIPNTNIICSFLFDAEALSSPLFMYQ